MDNIDRTALGVALTILLIISVFTAVVVAAVLKEVTVRVDDVPKHTVKPTHLPTICRKFYDSGTQEWVKCMGVERK